MKLNVPFVTEIKADSFFSGEFLLNIFIGYVGSVRNLDCCSLQGGCLDASNVNDLKSISF